MRLAILAASLVLAAAAAAPAPAADPPPPLPADLAGFLRAYLGPPAPGAEPSSTRVALAWSDLDGDGRPEAVAYVSGRAGCGTGGCLLLVLQRQGETFQLRGRATVARPPIGLLPSRSHGWRDLAVLSAGAGDPVGFTAVLPYDGARYAPNPTTAPARRLDADAWVQALIVPADPGAPL